MLKLEWQTRGILLVALETFVALDESSARQGQKGAVNWF